MKNTQISNIGIIINPRKEEVLRYLDDIDKWVEQSGHKVEIRVCTYQSKYLKQTYKNIKYCDEKILLNNSELILTLGGDGTILRAVQAQESDNSKLCKGSQHLFRWRLSDA